MIISHVDDKKSYQFIFSVIAYYTHCRLTVFYSKCVQLKYQSDYVQYRRKINFVQVSFVISCDIWCFYREIDVEDKNIIRSKINIQWVAKEISNN